MGTGISGSSGSGVPDKSGVFHPDPPGKFSDDPGKSGSGNFRSVLSGSARELTGDPGAHEKRWKKTKTKKVKQKWEMDKKWWKTQKQVKKDNFKNLYTKY